MISKLRNKLAAAKTRRRSGAKIIFFRDRTYYVADDWKNQFDGGVEMDLMLELEHAKCQWKNMQNIYNEVSDPALIDAVIYQMIAAEHRYEHLLQLAKRESLTCENIPIR